MRVVSFTSVLYIGKLPNKESRLFFVKGKKLVVEKKNKYYDNQKFTSRSYFLRNHDQFFKNKII